MTFLIKNAKITHRLSSYHNQNVDILIENGVIVKIEREILQTADNRVFDAKGACLFLGFMDIGAQIGDPGFEHREDILSATKAAAFGGYTAIAMLPNTVPVIDNKTNVDYVKHKSSLGIVDFMPIGAVSQSCKGENISEMYDLHVSGVVAFSDGEKVIKDAGLMLRALQYVKAFDGLIMNFPYDKSVAIGGQMHEGAVSTSLGMKGIPSLAEEMMLVRDLYLLEYSESRLHVQNISTRKSVDLIRQAKKKGFKVTASVPVLNLSFDDETLINFDTALKVLPPLRSADDILALLEGLKDGTIDMITSNHVPLDEEACNLEFPYASFGAIGLETAVSTAYTYCGLSVEELSEKFSIGPRNILNMEIPKIEKGEVANFTIFDPNTSTNYSLDMIFSKSKNSPFIGKTLKGSVVAVINKEHMMTF